MIDVFSNANVPTLLATLAPKAIVVYGVATDFCDRYTSRVCCGTGRILAGHLSAEV